VSFWAAWIYFARVRARDLREGPTIRRTAAWISRLYLYGAAFVGLVVAVVALTTIIGTFLDLLARPEGMGNGFGGQVLVAGLTVPTAAWWVRPVLAAAAMAVIWGYLWIGHWLYTDGLNTRGDEQGQEERASRVRIAFFIGLVAVGVGLTASAFGQGIGALVGYVVGAPRNFDALPLWRDAIGIPVSAAPAIAVWWFHRRRGAKDRATADGSALGAVRPMDYVTALTGLNFLTGGLVAVLGRLFQHAAVADPGFVGVPSWLADSALYVGFAAAGLAVWLWPWLAIQRRLQLDRPSEVRSSSRRYFLFFVVGASVVAGTYSLAIIVSQAVRVAVGLDSSAFGYTVSYPLAFLAVAAVVLIFHATVLRRDTALGTEAPAEAVAALGPVEPVELAEPGQARGPVEGAREAAQLPLGSNRELVIVGPEGADLDALRATLAATLPAGYSLAVRPAGEAPAS
jgi:hypothetical protein